MNNALIKILSIFFLCIACSLAMSAAEANAFYRVTANQLNGRGLPNKTAVKKKQYAKHDVVYITYLSDDQKWGYVYRDDAWVSMAYIQKLNAEELAAYKKSGKWHSNLPQAGTKEQTARATGSKPLRILLWVFLGCLALGPLLLLLIGEPQKSIEVFLVTMLLCAGLVVLASYVQFVLCWGLKIVGWIEHYILFGWLVDAFANGILAIIPFCLDLPTFGAYGFAAGVLPAFAFFHIGEIYTLEDDTYPFAQWIIYVFQIAMFLAVLVIDNSDYYLWFNNFMQLDGVPAISTLANACDWGEYANSTFIAGFSIGTLTLLAPRVLVLKVLGKYI